MKKELQQGFTLVELMIVIAVIAILATLGLVGFRSAQESARDTQRMNNLRGLQVALECYFSTEGNYATSITWNDLVTTFTGTSCWSADADAFRDNPPGDAVDGTTGNITRGSTVVASYDYSTADDEYTLTLNGESRTVSVSSPE